MRIKMPTLPYAPKDDKWANELTRTLTNYLRDVTNQLNNMTEGQCAAVTNATLAPPTQGTYAQGDFVRNAKPVAGAPFGWVCTAGGNPGTWKPVLIGA